MTKKLAANEGQAVVFDAAIAAITGDYQQRQAQREEERNLTPKQRKQRTRDAARRKVTLDFAQANGLENAVRQAAEDESCGLSSYALWLMKLGLERVRSEGLTPKKKIARSLKYSYDVELV
jgi:hypothetical protein